MRGEVLHYDEDQGFGFITGADGNRYTFTRENLRRQTAMPRGTAVEFQAGGGQARDVFSIATASPTAGASAAPPQANPAPTAGAAQAQPFGPTAEPAEPSKPVSQASRCEWRGTYSP